MPDLPAVLHGGQFDGKITRISPEIKTIVCPWLPPGALDPIELPPYRWWHRLRAGRCPFPPPPPGYRNLLYTNTGETLDGKMIYRYEGDE